MYVLGLIREVKKYPFLFDRKSPENKILLSREMAWKEIGATLGYPPQICKARWKTLKDKFVKDAKEMQDKNVSGKIWKHFIAMSFLYDYLDIKRPGIGRGDSFLDKTRPFDEALDSVIDQTMDGISQNDETTCFLEHNFTSRKNIQKSLNDKNNIAPFDFMSCDTTSKGPTKKVPDENHDQFYILMDRIANIAEKLLLDNEQKEDGFLKFLTSILSKVDARSQDRIKVEILNFANERVDEIENRQ